MSRQLTISSLTSCLALVMLALFARAADPADRATSSSLIAPAQVTAAITG